MTFKILYCVFECIFYLINIVLESNNLALLYYTHLVMSIT